MAGPTPTSYKDGSKTPSGHAVSPIPSVGPKPSSRRHPSGGAKVTPMPGRAAIDATLMSRIRDQRDRAALDELAHHYAPRLKGWLTRRGEQAQTAEDIVQDVLLTVWTKAALYDENKAAFSTWVFRATRNRWFDHKRKHDRVTMMEPDVMASFVDSPTPGVDEIFNQKEAALAVRKELAELSADHRNMLYLAFYEGLTHSEIAERTGIALGTVKSRIRAPLKKMREKLTDYRGGIDDKS